MKPNSVDRPVPLLVTLVTSLPPVARAQPPAIDPQADEVLKKMGATLQSTRSLSFFKDSPAHPQYTAFLSDWNLSAATDDAQFALNPATGAKKVEFAPATQPAAVDTGARKS